MNDQEIKELIAMYQFGDPSLEQKIFWLAQEVERTTRQNYFSLIQRANNAATSREITPRELDQFVWDVSQKNRLELIRVEQAKSELEQAKKVVGDSGGGDVSQG